MGGDHFHTQFCHALVERVAIISLIPDQPCGSASDNAGGESWYSMGDFRRPSTVDVDGEMIVGGIHWVQLLSANGRAPRGRRPAVILQDALDTCGLPVVLVVPLTTARRAMCFAGTARIRPTAENRCAAGSTWCLAGMMEFLWARCFFIHIHF